MSTTTNSGERRTVRSVPISDRVFEDAFDSATKLRAVERRKVSQTEMYERWIETGRAIYCATTREEAVAAANALFDSNPDHKEG